MPTPISRVLLCEPHPAQVDFDPSPLGHEHREHPYRDPELLSVCRSFSSNSLARLPDIPASAPQAAPHRAVLSAPVLAAEIPPEHAMQFGKELAVDYLINGAPGPLEVLEYAFWESLPFMKVPQPLRGPLIKGVATLKNKARNVFEQMDLARVYNQTVTQSLLNFNQGLARTRQVKVRQPGDHTP